MLVDRIWSQERYNKNRKCKSKKKKKALDFMLPRERESTDVYIVCGEWTGKKGHPARVLI